jgi:hypothetical protein
MDRLQPITHLIWKVALAAIVLAAGHVAAEEQRCAELGASCQCSEPLNFSSNAISGVFDPPDSKTKQCNGGRSIDSSRTEDTVPGSTVGLPSVDHVLRVSSSNGGNMLDSNRSFTNGSYCIRNYFMHSTNFPAPGPTQRVKGPRNTKGGPSPGFESELTPGSGSDPVWAFAPQGNHDTPFGALPTNGVLPSVGDPLRLSSCKGRWCRLEICYDHNLRGANRLQFRARATRVDDGKVFQYQPGTSVGSSSTATSGENSFPVLFFTQGMPSGHFTYYSHVMVAKTNVADGNFWIGPAFEIEGSTSAGGGGTESGGDIPSGSGTGGGGSDGTTENADDDAGSTGDQLVSATTGLPFQDGFESGLSNWPHSGMQSTTDRAFGGSTSVAGNAVSGETDSSWLLHYWGDANAVSGGDISCGSACPGGRTEDVSFRFKFFMDAASSLANAGSFEIHRKIAILGSFHDWDATFGQAQQNSGYYFSLPVGNFNSTPGIDLAFNSWRRHDNAGNQIADVVDSAQANDVFFPGNWYDVRVRAKLNALGQANGILQVWVDDRLVIDRQDMNFRGGYDQATWNYLMLTDNGSGPSSGTARFFWDDVTIGEGTSQTPTQPVVAAPFLLK